MACSWNGKLCRTNHTAVYLFGACGTLVISNGDAPGAQGLVVFADGMHHVRFLTHRSISGALFPILAPAICSPRTLQRFKIPGYTQARCDLNHGERAGEADAV